MTLHSTSSDSCRYILIIVISAILFLSLMNIYVTYKRIQEDFIERRDCKISFDSLCDNPNANLSSIQLLTRWNKSNDQKLKDIYDFKKSKRILDLPCFVNFESMYEINKNGSSEYVHKLFNMDEELNNNFGNMALNDWGFCYFKEKHGKPVETDAYIIDDDERLRFKTLQYDAIKRSVCENKKQFFESMIIPNPEFKFYKIKCSILNDNPIQIVVDSFNIVQYDKDKNEFYTVDTVNDVQKLFSISYDNVETNYLPRKRKLVSFIMEYDLCNGYNIKSQQTFDFNLTMIGINKMFITNANTGMGFTSKDILTSTKSITEAKTELLDKIESYERDIYKNKLKDYDSCRTKYKLDKNFNMLLLTKYQKQRKNTSAISQYINDVHNKILSLNNFIIYLERYIKNMNFQNMMNLNIQENKIVSQNICGLSMNNKADLQQIIDIFTSCKNTYMNMLENPDRFSFAEIELLNKKINAINEFQKTVNENEFITSAINNKLQGLQAIIGTSCYDPSRYNNTVQQAILRTSNFKLKLMNSNIDRGFFNTIKGKNMYLDNSLFDYVSQDNCIYLLVPDD